MKLTDIIYKNQEYTSNLLLSDLDKSSNLLLVAEPQSGKTGVLVDFAYKLQEKYNGKLRANIYFPSDITLKKQNIKRFADTEYSYETMSTSDTIELSSSTLATYYPSNLHLPKAKENFQKKIEENRRHALRYNGCLLHMHDESHRDINKKGIFTEVFEKNQIPYSFDENFTRTCNEVTLLCTATPSPQIAIAKKCLKNKEKMPFNIRYLKPGENYIGFKHLYETGRIQQSYKLFSIDKKNVIINIENMQKFKNEVMYNFICGNNAKPGYGIVRLCSDEEYNKFKIEIQNFANSINKKITVKIYNCKNENIDELSNDILNKTNDFQICVIIDSYLQGKTFEDLSNVRFWFDTFDKNKNNDVFVAQSAGRNCGYFKDKNYQYPIFTDISIVQKLINFYDKIEIANTAVNDEWIFDLPILTGTYIKLKQNSDKNKSKYNWEIFFHDSLEDRNNHEKLAKVLGFDPSYMSNGGTLSKNANENSDDVIGHIIDQNFPHLGGSRQKDILKSKKLRGEIKEDIVIDKYCGTILLDDPTNLPNYKFHKSWNILIRGDIESEYYGAENKYLTYVGTPKTVDQILNEKVEEAKEDKTSIYSTVNRQLTQLSNQQAIIEEKYVLEYELNGQNFILKDKKYAPIYAKLFQHIISNLSQVEIKFILKDLSENKIISDDLKFFYWTKGNNSGQLDASGIFAKGEKIWAKNNFTPHYHQIKNNNDVIYVQTKSSSAIKDLDLKKLNESIQKINKNFTLKVVRNGENIV